MLTEQPSEEPLRRNTILFGLEKGVYHISILIGGPLQVVLPTADLHEYFIDVEGIAVTATSQIRAIVEPDRVTDGMGRKSVPFMYLA